jgi:hypothetical protein
LTEAAVDALNNLDHPAVDSDLAADEKRLDQVTNILEKKEAGRPITSEDYLVLDRLIKDVEGRIIAQRAEVYAEVRRQRAEIRRQIPEAAWHLELGELDLPGRIHNLLLDNEIETVGDVLLTLEIDEKRFLDFRGFSDEMLETLKEYVAAFDMPELVEVVEGEPAVEVEAILEGEAEAAVVEEEVDVDVVEEADVEAVEVEAVEVEDLVAAEEEALDEEESVEEEESLEEEVEEEEVVSDIDDLSRSIFEPQVQEKPKKKGKIVVVTTGKEEEEEDDDKGVSRRGRSYVYDDKVGEVVVKRKRKDSRRRSDWDDFDEDLID